MWLIFRFDLVNKNGSLNLYGKELKLDGIYDITGQILVLPITGTGPINIRMGNRVLYYNKIRIRVKCIFRFS